MTIERLDRIAEIERTHFWFTARRRIVHDALRRLSLPDPTAIVDAGCGTGTILHGLAGGGARIGIDPLGEHLGAAATGTRPAFLRGTITSLPMRADSTDVVLALDVLEHVDDVTALAEVRRILRPTGHLVLTVPAGPRLWSARDDEAGHLRRYTRASIRAALRATGFEVDRCSAFHGALLPLLVASRVAGRRSTTTRDMEDNPRPVVNRILSAVTGAEAAFAERGLRPPVGSSLIVIAEPSR
jgi:SAM-dependent methyltransferase